MDTATLTILFDNYAGLPELQTLWGFAALIRTPVNTILFDTGSNGRVLLKNMQALGIEPIEIDTIFLSHNHWDHIGGVDSILELNSNVTLVLHEGFSKHLINDLRGLCHTLIIVGNEPYELAHGIYSTGILAADPPEQALILEIGASLAIIGGCSHPGIAQLVEQSQAFVNKPVRWAIGGFHLMYSHDAEITAAIAQLQALGVSEVAATHCTGDAARIAFRAAYGAGFIEGGVGRTIELC
ncbi:MBL fold metallo-hydrolase [Chromatium okenii]|uniref:MBL fold metallo-hydrolase n=1 Tax=Chromatium okenii TaxID=61644 RepID=A0A2S7XS82_9GAMM|nr:MBL fold metallo-hydrolase [Chromatium okenii]MBV5311026.1 MBL fold metallo-hydrolase [Chromatium okenii]PQJ96575.1 MBL fold metallo-hydrolase [Chromatium okenii]